MPLRIRSHIIYPQVQKPEPAPKAPLEKKPEVVRRVLSDRRAWELWETELLRKCYPSAGAAPLMGVLKRSEGSIRQKAHYLGIEGPGPGRVFNDQHKIRDQIVADCLREGTGNGA